MQDQSTIQVLLIEDNEETIRTVTQLLRGEDESRFAVTAVHSIGDAVKVLRPDHSVDLVLLSYGLAGNTGASTVDELRQMDVHVPILFLGTRKDLSMAVDAMRVGARDFIPVEDLDKHVFPQTLIGHHERSQLADTVEQLEVKRARLEAMQGLVVEVSEQITEPISKMRETIRTLESRNTDEKAAKYLVLIRENLDRLSLKMEKLRNLKEDKTVKYIKDIKMIDLS